MHTPKKAEPSRAPEYANPAVLKLRIFRAYRVTRDVLSLGGLDFTDSNEYIDPLDVAIARDLWRWRSLPEPDRVVVTAPQSMLALSLEYYLCGVFRYENSAPSCGWWCDGVIELSIEELDDTSFRMVGAAYWAKAGHKSSPFFLAPFEIEMYFPRPQADVPSRSIVRFGAMDHLGNIQKSPHNGNAVRLIAKRPQRNTDWAFAIELTDQPSQEP